jgi:hypothetical protein
LRAVTDPKRTIYDSELGAKVTTAVTRRPEELASVRRCILAAAQAGVCDFDRVPIEKQTQPPLILNPRKARPRDNVARLDPVWQSGGVKKRTCHRLSAVLGMVAMLGALIALPMTTSIALAMAGPLVAKSTAHEMPCHKPVKPCPNCPQKVCPDMGTCLVKCFQPLASPLAETTLPHATVSLRVPPGLSQAANSSLIPPLLRPPSV